MRYIKVIICFMAVCFACLACTNEPVFIQKQIKVTVSPAHVLDDFEPVSTNHIKMLDSDGLGHAELRITALIYDEKGVLAEKKVGYIRDYDSDYSFSVLLDVDQKYTMLCFSSAVIESEDGTYESYEFTRINEMSTLQVRQNRQDSFSSNFSVLGISSADLSSENDEVEVVLTPATAFVYLYWQDIHAHATDISGVYSATATDYSGDDTYTWEIIVEQYNDEVIVKNFSPFLNSIGLTADLGYQIYSGYIENGRIVIPQGQEVGFDYNGSPILLYGVDRIEDNTIYPGDLILKIGSGKLISETGFSTSVPGQGLWDLFDAGIEFKSLSTTTGSGVDRYAIVYHSNDIVAYEPGNGFYYRTSLNDENNYGSTLEPANYPDGKNIYQYINLLPGKYSSFGRAFIGNDIEDFSSQEIEIEAGKQYRLHMDCDDMSLYLIPGPLKSEFWNAEEILYGRKQKTSCSSAGFTAVKLESLF